MATLQIDGAALEGPLYTSGVAYAEVKKRWDDEWQWLPYLTPIHASLSAAPGLGEAVFQKKYGLTLREDATAWAHEAPLYLANWFVRIVLLRDGIRTVLWTGLIQESTYSVFADPNLPAGDQQLTAYTLDSLLDRIHIIGAWTDEGKGEGDPSVYIKKTPTFNQSQAWFPYPIGNRSATRDANGVARFGRDKLKWTALDVVEYLLAHYCGDGLTDTGTTRFPFKLAGQTDALSQFWAIWNLEGHTIRQALDKLIDRYRGLGWTLRIDGDTPMIWVYTQLAEDLDLQNPLLGESIHIPGNAEQYPLTWDSNIKVLQNSITLTEGNQYERIVVQGAPVKSTFTATVEDGTLAPVWTAEDEADYQQITTPDDGNQTRFTADSIRASDRWQPVYQAFALAPNWDWTINGNPVMPSFDDLANVIPSVSAPVWNQIIRPLERVTTVIKPYVAKGEFGGNVEYQPPAVYLRADLIDQQYVQGDMAHLKGGGMLTPSVSLRMLDTLPGFLLQAPAPHVLGLNHYDASQGQSAIIPAYDYTALKATLCIEGDMRPTVMVNFNKPDAAPYTRTLYLQVPQAQFWWLVPGTIVRQNNDLTLQVDGGRATRDDTEILRQVAAFASAWYGDHRNILAWTEADYLVGILPGQYINGVTASWDYLPINTVITQVSFDFVRQTTTVQTSWGEIDAAILLNIPGMSDFREVGREFNKLSASVELLRARMAELPSRWAMGGGSTQQDPGNLLVAYFVDRFDRTDRALDGYWLGVKSPAGSQYYALDDYLGYDDAAALSAYTIRQTDCQSSFYDGTPFVLTPYFHELNGSLSYVDADIMKVKPASTWIKSYPSIGYSNYSITGRIVIPTDIAQTSGWFGSFVLAFGKTTRSFVKIQWSRDVYQFDDQSGLSMPNNPNEMTLIVFLNDDFGYLHFTLAYTPYIDFRLDVLDGEATLTVLNRTLVWGGTSSRLYQQPCGPLHCLFTAANNTFTGNAKKPAYLAHLKAWSADMEEPPDETGYGNHKPDAPFVKTAWLDKYHTPVKNEAGTIIRYDYNPNA